MGVFMKRYIQRLLPLLLGAFILLSSCSSLPELSYRDGVYTDKKSGISYTHAPAYYEAISYTQDTEIGKLAEGAGVLVYPIKGVDPAKMICTKNYEILCAVGNTMPELWDMNLTKLHICKTVIASYALAEVTDAAVLEKIAEIYGGTAFPASEIAAGLKNEKFDLKFESTNLPGVYYCLIYQRFEEDVLIYEDIEDPDTFVSSYPNAQVSVHAYEDGSGSYYAEYNFGKEILYNRSTDSCYALGDTLISYMEEEETEANT